MTLVSMETNSNIKGCQGNGHDWEPEKDLYFRALSNMPEREKSEPALDRWMKSLPSVIDAYGIVQAKPLSRTLRLRWDVFACAVCAFAFIPFGLWSYSLW